jgi:hypothetical protein
MGKYLLLSIDNNRYRGNLWEVPMDGWGGVVRCRNWSEEGHMLALLYHEVNWFHWARWCRNPAVRSFTRAAVSGVRAAIASATARVPGVGMMFLGTEVALPSV